MINVELLTKTLQHIKDNLRGWNQNDWRQVMTDDEGLPEIETMCGTAMCFAGEAVQIGDPDAYLITPEVLKKVRALEDKELAVKLTVECDELSALVIDPKGYFSVRLSLELAKLRGVDQVLNVSDLAIRAEQLLGLDYYEQKWLFATSNSLDDLEEIVDMLVHKASTEAAATHG